MNLKIISAQSKLPFRIAYKTKSYVFPRVPKLPSVCVDPFEDAYAASLIKKMPNVFDVASEAEVKAELERKAKLGIVDAPGPDPLELTDETLLAGTVTVKDFFELNVPDAIEFIETTEQLDDEVLKQLLSIEVAGKNRKGLTEVLTALVQQDKPE